MPRSNEFFELDKNCEVDILRLTSPDQTNRLTRACVLALTEEIHTLAIYARPLIITGNSRFFSVGADLNEIAALTGPEAYKFSQMGQALMNAIAAFPALVIAAIEGPCFGGGLDFALVCHRRIAAPSAVFGHRGATLGLITGWSGTQSLPRLIGKARALELFVTAEKVNAHRALEIGLVDAIADDPIAKALHDLRASSAEKS